MENQDMTRAVGAIARVDVVPTVLKVMCEMTGLRFATVARLDGTMWHGCAIRDGIGLKVAAGDPLPFLQALKLDAKSAASPFLMTQASTDERWSTRHTQGCVFVRTMVSVPIVLDANRLFGVLCAVDAKQVDISAPQILAMFKDFAALLAAQLAKQTVREQEQAALLDERATSELREQFIAVLGHDLRNPLQAVQASGEVLERRLTDPAQRAIAARIKTQTKRMAMLIDDVLDFARGRLGGGIGLETTDVKNVNAGLITVIQELEDAYPDIEVIADIRVSRSVRCDLGRLQQVAANLLGNAVTHGKPRSAVKITARTDENDLVLEVWNAGEPIPPESLPKIFEPFWRRSGSTNSQGLGLGLHICAQIMRAHEGHISVLSSREHGTRFTARLPLLGAAPVALVLPALEGLTVPSLRQSSANG